MGIKGDGESMSIYAQEPGILLVEERQGDVLLSREALIKAEVSNRVYAVSNGEEAVCYLEGRAQFGDRHEFPLPNLVLLDLNIAQRDNFMVLRWIRAHPAHEGPRIVMLSTSDESEAIDHAHALGANSYLVRPEKLEAYVELIGSAVRFWCNNARPLNAGAAPSRMLQAGTQNGSLVTGATNQLDLQRLRRAL